jgi:outer membrane immunogenic protein
MGARLLMRPPGSKWGGQMKTIAVAIVALGALLGSSFAADMGAPYYNPPPPFLPIDTWTGFYIGANAGWIRSSGNSMTNTGTDTGLSGLGTALALGLIPGTIEVSHSGFIGGGQIGYNWQYGPNWVWGIEADFDGTSAKGTAASAFPGSAAIPPMTSVFSRDLDTLGTVRARAGYPSYPNMLWYVTAGLAYGESKLSSAWSCQACLPPTGAGTALQTSSTLVGWTAGAGVEWKFAPAWSVKAEYLYVDLGSQSNTIFYNYVGFSSTMTSTVNERENIVRAGVNYKFW